MEGMVRMVEKSFNLKVVDVKKEIIGILNNSGLPISIIGMIMKEVNSELQIDVNNYLANERQQYEDAVKKEQEKEQEESK
jgi:DNA-binding transcriptional MerR regulator